MHCELFSIHRRSRLYPWMRSPFCRIGHRYHFRASVLVESKSRRRYRHSRLSRVVLQVCLAPVAPCSSQCHFDQPNRTRAHCQWWAAACGLVSQRPFVPAPEKVGGMNHRFHDKVLNKNNYNFLPRYALRLLIPLQRIARPLIGYLCLTCAGTVLGDTGCDFGREEACSIA